MSIKTIGRSLLFSIAIFLAPIASHAQYFSVGVTIGVPPPPLPVYAQPAWPGDGYVWVPGYWAYADDEGYYWVPGTWTLAPEPGLLWTPGYWAWQPAGYVWNAGYWGPHVGFYGGINYGFGYFGTGFSGGYWANNTYFCNGAVTNIDAFHGSAANVYYGHGGFDHPNSSRVSYNGGGGGTRSHPNPAELAAAREPHVGWTNPQRQQADMARSVPGLAAAANHGYPSIAATPRAGQFTDRNLSSPHADHGAAVPRQAAYVSNGRESPTRSTSSAPGRRDSESMSKPYGNPRGQVYASQGVRTDRPSWASGQLSRTGSVGGLTGADRSRYGTNRSDTSSAVSRGAPSWGASRHPSTIQTYSGQSAHVPAVTQSQTRVGRNSPFASQPQQSSGAWTRPNRSQWSGGYSSPARIVPSRSDFAGSSPPRWAPARAPTGGSGGYGGGAAPRFIGGGPAHTMKAAQGGAPEHRR
jgi:hypothetical protein